MMEKRGVVRGENEEPVVTKAAAEGSGKCCGGKSCGGDAVSKMSDVAAGKVVIRSANKEVPDL